MDVKEAKVNFLTIPAGSMFIFRGDLPHRHVAHGHHASVMHGDMKFPIMKPEMYGDGASTSPQWIRKYFDDMNYADSNQVAVSPKNYDRMLSYENDLGDGSLYS